MINENLSTKVKEILRFGIVGILATLINYSIFAIFKNIVGINVAYSLGYGLSLIFNFILSNYYTFKSTPTKNKSIKFVLSHGFNYLLQIVLLNLFISISIPSIIAPIFVYCISIPINFLLVRRALKNE